MAEDEFTEDGLSELADSMGFLDEQNGNSTIAKKTKENRLNRLVQDVSGLVRDNYLHNNSLEEATGAFIGLYRELHAENMDTDQLQSLFASIDVHAEKLFNLLGNKEAIEESENPSVVYALDIGQYDDLLGSLEQLRLKTGFVSDILDRPHRDVKDQQFIAVAEEIPAIRKNKHTAEMYHTLKERQGETIAVVIGEDAVPAEKKRIILADTEEEAKKIIEALEDPADSIGAILNLMGEEDVVHISSVEKDDYDLVTPLSGETLKENVLLHALESEEIVAQLSNGNNRQPPQKMSRIRVGLISLGIFGFGALNYASGILTRDTVENAMKGYGLHEDLVTLGVFEEDSDTKFMTQISDLEERFVRLQTTYTSKEKADALQSKRMEKTIKEQGETIEDMASAVTTAEHKASELAEMKRLYGQQQEYIADLQREKTDAETAVAQTNQNKESIRKYGMFLESIALSSLDEQAQALSGQISVYEQQLSALEKEDTEYVLKENFAASLQEKYVAINEQRLGVVTAYVQQLFEDTTRTLPESIEAIEEMRKLASSFTGDDASQVMAILKPAYRSEQENALSLADAETAKALEQESTIGGIDKAVQAYETHVATINKSLSN